MRWLYTSLAYILLIYTDASAQDIIQRTDSVKIEAKIVEVKGSEIRFTKHAESTGKLYIISTEDVAAVTFQDGTVRRFTTSPIVSVPAITYNTGRHILGIRPADLAFTNFSLFYERLSATQKFGIRLPLSIGIGHSPVRGDVYNNFSMLRNRTFSTGLDLNFYVGRPDKFRYYIGPSFQLGFFRYVDYSYYYPYPSAPPTKIGTHYALLLNNGIWYQLGKNILLGMDLGLGFQRRITRRGYIYDPPNTIKLSGNLSAGIQF
jgi:hypothetical protein